MAAGSKNSIVFGSSFCHRQACGTDGVTEVWESLLFHRCQTSSCARHESRAVRRHHEDHRPEHIEGEQAPGGKRPKGASSRLSLAAPGRLEPFQRACSATVPEKSLRCAIFPNFRLESGRNGGRGFYESIKLTQTQGHPQTLLRNRKNKRSVQHHESTARCKGSIDNPHYSPLDHRGDALAAADAQGGEAGLGVAFDHLV